MSPEEIRDLRGDLSREDFAEAIGVTPLTVYRWELPIEEKESRRPQRRIQRRLRDFRSRDSRSRDSKASESPTSFEPSPGTPLKGPEDPFPRKHEPVVDVYDDIFRAKWSAAQTTIVDQLSQPGDPDAAIAAQVAQAMLKILWTNDVQAAWSLVAPLLQRPEVATWPAALALPLHCVAALLHAAPDGRLFSPGRVNAHIAQADRFDLSTYPEFHALLNVAEMWSAFHLGDAAHHDRLRHKYQENFRMATSTVVKWMAWEVGSIAAHLSGCIVEAIRFFRQLVEAGRHEGLPVIEVRASGYLAWIMLMAAESVDDIAKLVDQAQLTALHQRIVPGWPSVLVTSALAEIACRRGKLDEAMNHVEQGLSDARHCEWAPIELGYTDVRLNYLKGVHVDATWVESRYGNYAGGHRAPLTRVVSAFTEGLSALNQTDYLTSSIAFRRAAEIEQEIGTFPVYETYGLALSYYAAVLAGDFDTARQLLRKTERSLERLPMFWCSASLRLFKSLHAALEGRVADAFHHADASEAAFLKVGDKPQTLLAARLRAICAVILEEDDAEVRLENSADMMRHAGVTIPGPYQKNSIASLKERIHSRESLNLAESGGLSILSQATNRLSMRGISPNQVLDELIDLLTQWRTLTTKPSVWLDELPQVGRPVELTHTDKDEPAEFIEFGDGAGRRLRVGVGGVLDSDERMILQMMVQMTSMALEIVTLRGLTSTTTSAASDVIPTLPGFIAASKGSRELLAEVGRVAKSRANVLLLGESGVGKEMVAHAVYKLSPRSSRAFITFNCAAVPRELFEGQFFGYRKGAFTGATSNHPGVLRAADGGTLFLDEIGDLPLDLQPKLLRFLENGEVFPLGETRPLRVDVRVIAATHRKLEEMVAAGSFREDLYYRLAVVPIHISPLRERREDIVALAQHFLRNMMDTPPGFSADAAKALVEHNWPGNVRELRNVMERTIAYVQNQEIIRAEDLKF